MATTIRSTALDFNNIKNNLKTFLQNKEEFTDYDFEASGLSNILDVLAHNTHINGLIANFAINESYLPTAQLRSSMVSLSEGIGYVPDTATSSQAKIRVSTNLTGDTIPTTITMPAYTKFNSTVDDVSYSFQTIEAFTATKVGTGFYEFKASNGSNNIPVFEGTFKTKTFIVGAYEDNPVYVIPDSTLDADTVTVKVFNSVTSSDFSTYQNIVNATSISANSTVYILKESPNGYFELSFGDGTTFGVAPSAGNRIEVEYLSTKGSVANGASSFVPANTLSVTLTDETTTAATLATSTFVNSVGGDDKESIESIRKNAPFQYATQNRMVTAKDYASLILRNYSTLIRDIISWGGEDALQPEFGAVYVSIAFESDVSDETISSTKIAIQDLANQLSIVSFNLRFVNPITTFIEADVFFQFNSKLTDQSQSNTENTVRSTVANYFTNNTGNFNQAFRRSNMLALIDDVSTAVLSSRADIRMQQRIIPSAPAISTAIKALLDDPVNISASVLNSIVELVVKSAFLDAANYMINNKLVTNYTSTFIIDSLVKVKNRSNQQLLFPTSIAIPDDDQYVINSSLFVFNGVNSVIKNKLGSTTLQIIADGTNTVLLDNLGSYNASNGTITINFFTPSSIIGGAEFIKISAKPANQSAIAPTRNDLLVYDRDRSAVTAVLTDATN